MEDNLIKAGTENFNLPHDIVPLPTGGLFYKSKKKSVKVGYLTASDENILMGSLDGSNRDGIVLNLLRNKLYEHDLRPEELLEGDIEAILIFLRNTSFGPEYSVNVTDPKSGKLFETKILLDEINIKKGNSSPNSEGLFVTTLPKTGVEVKLKPLTFSETLELEKMAEQYPAGRIAPKVTWRLNKIVQEINGDNNKGTIAKFIDSLPIMDSKHIRNFLKENQPSLDLKKQVATPSGEMVTVDITFGVEFFRPFF